MNNRRKLLIAIGAASFTPRALFAQAKQKPVLIGWLSLGSERSNALPAFKQALIALGWKEVQFTLEARWADGQIERLRPLAEELAAKRPAVIVAPGTRAAQAATKVAPSIPFVVLTSADPVATGLAASLARPGGMVTGVTTLVAETSAKHLELLLDCVPKIRRVGILIDPSGANSALRREVLQRSAAQRSVDARFAEAAKRADIEPALSRLARENIEALILASSDVFFFSEREAIVKFALAQRWPMVSSSFVSVELGALLSYGGDPAELYRRGASYVDRILRGAKPGDLPIEQSATFELAVNLKAAKALGITIPQTVMIQATRVIKWVFTETCG